MPRWVFGSRRWARADTLAAHRARRRLLVPPARDPDLPTQRPALNTPHQHPTPPRPPATRGRARRRTVLPAGAPPRPRAGLCQRSLRRPPRRRRAQAARPARDRAARAAAAAAAPQGARPLQGQRKRRARRDRRRGARCVRGPGPGGGSGVFRARRRGPAAQPPHGSRTSASLSSLRHSFTPPRPTAQASTCAASRRWCTTRCPPAPTHTSTVAAAPRARAARTASRSRWWVLAQGGEQAWEAAVQPPCVLLGGPPTSGPDSLCPRSPASNPTSPPPPPAGEPRRGGALGRAAAGDGPRRHRRRAAGVPRRPHGPQDGGAAGRPRGEGGRAGAPPLYGGP
jgi:hypothetical protein